MRLLATVLVIAFFMTIIISVDRGMAGDANVVPVQDTAFIGMIASVVILWWKWASQPSTKGMGV